VPLSRLPDWQREDVSQLLHFNTNDSSANVAMGFAGGLGLAAYHAGVHQAFSERGIPLQWVSGSSAGAVTAALISGNRSQDRIERLREFWNFPSEGFTAGPWQRWYSWAGAIPTRLVGNAGHFHPRVPSLNPFGFRSFYDLA
jgi:NTE family protein